MIQTLFGSLQEQEDPEKLSLLERMRAAVTRTRDSLGERIDWVLSMARAVDEAALEDLEMSLIASDIGVTTAAEITQNLRERAKRQQIRNGAELKDLLKEQIRDILDENGKTPARASAGPEVIMMVGVNGTGKTTTSGKLAAYFRAQGRSALLCAADTFRAAAIEQLEVWGERSGVEMIRSKHGADPSAVLFDALQMAKTRHTDVVIVDTAGRLHTKTGLMAELDKMRRTAQRIVPEAPQEVLLVLDATTGQNGLQQARLFTESAGVTGIVLTKLDGTAKGGIAVAIAREMKLPVRFVGVGEALGDLLPFDSGAFVQSLLD
jgi:fused signal recognition particle receptor